MKKRMKILMALLVGHMLTGCSEPVDEKTSIKNEISEVLTGKNVTAIDILTVGEGIYGATIQMQGNIERKDVDELSAVTFVEEISKKVEELDLLGKVQVELIDANNQLLIIYNSDGSYQFFN